METNIAISGVEFLDSSFEELIEFTTHFKVNYIELWPKNIVGRKHSKIRKILDKNKIKVACVNAPVNLGYPHKEQQEEIIKSLNLANEFGAKYISTFFGRNPKYNELISIDVFKRVIAPCLKLAEDKGIIICVENEFDKMKELTRKVEGCLDLLSSINSPYFKLNFDPCNFYIAGEEPYPYAYQMLREHIVYIHIKDATRHNELLHGEESRYVIWEDITGKYICCPVGEGGVNYEGFLTRLSKDNYDGFLTLEPHTVKEKLKDSYGKTILYLEEKLGGENESSSYRRSE